MSIESLKHALPDYAKDLKLNLSSLAAETVLTEQQKAGTFVASALAARNSAVSDALIAEFAPKLSPEALTAAKAAASIMAMNNIYYRFTHLASSPDYKTLPAQAAHERDRQARRREGRFRAVVAGGLGDQRLRHVHRLATRRSCASTASPRSRCRPPCASPRSSMPSPPRSTAKLPRQQPTRWPHDVRAIRRGDWQVAPP